MTPEKWEKIKNNILDNFAVEDKGKTHIDEEGGIDIEYIVFAGPLGRMRLEYITKPVIINKKTTYSRRIGSETAVEYVYSPDEKSTMLKAYKWEEGAEEWVEMEAGMFS
jgi:hypothetical protein